MQVGYTFTWAWDNYSNAFSTYQEQFVRSLRVRRDRDDRRSPHLLPADVLDRLPRRRWKNLLLLFIMRRSSSPT